MGVVEDARFGGIDLSVWARIDQQTHEVYALLFRLLDDAAAAGALWDQFLTPPQREVIADGLGTTVEQARSLTAFIAGLRELGKLVPAFQHHERVAWARLSPQLTADAGPIPARTSGALGEVVTGRMSMHIAVGLLEDAGFPGGGNDAPVMRAAQAVGGMAGRFEQADLAGAASARRVAATAGGTAWQDLRSRYARLLRYLTGAAAVPQTFSVTAAVLVCGVGTLAGRLADQQRAWRQGAHMPAFGAAEHFARAIGRAREWVADAGLERVELEPAEFSAVHRQPGPTIAQASLMAALPALAGRGGVGILVVSDATGTGKSIQALEASRIFAQTCGTAGIAWLMPTTATADAGWETLERYVRGHHPDQAAVTLVSSHSRLNAAYNGTASTSHDPRLAPSTELSAPTRPDAEDDARERDRQHDPEPGGDVTTPGGFLREHDAALLAQFTAATIDQAQMSVLPVEFSALRLLALSGKTVVVDEAHALAPFSHLQLLRLLGWLGALRTPVVLLSATLPASTASTMVRSYLSGAGIDRRQFHGHNEQFAPGYPGWLYADAATGSPHRMLGSAQAQHAAAQRRPLRITLTPVDYRRLGDAGRPVQAGERLAAVAAALEQVTDSGGCAAVTCQSVADAQDTYRFLRHRWPHEHTELMLLHARFPGHVREARTAFLRRALGPAGRRPRRLIVITTSLLDTSLDIDVDVMISDLASIARLLQRAGRLARFGRQWPTTSHRPPWWRPDHVPQLTVLEPLGRSGGTAIPAGWGTVEPAALLHATAALLADESNRGTLSIPDDVQRLVELIHGAHSPFDQATAAIRRLMPGHQQRTAAAQHLSAVHLVPPPAQVSALADLHRQYLSAGQAATRLGTLPRRLLPCYRNRAGKLFLERAGTLELPSQQNLSAPQLRDILTRTVPVPAAWVAQRGPAHHPPEPWRGHRALSDLVLLPAPTGQSDDSEHFGIHALRMDDELGLVHHRMH